MPVTTLYCLLVARDEQQGGFRAAWLDDTEEKRRDAAHKIGQKALEELRNQGKCK